MTETPIFQRNETAAFDAVHVARGTISEFFLTYPKTSCLSGDEDVLKRVLLEDLAGFLKYPTVHGLRMAVYLPASGRPWTSAIDSLLNELSAESRPPVRFLRTETIHASTIGGIQLWAISGVDTSPIWDGEQLIGRRWTENQQEIIVLGNVHAPQAKLSPEMEALEMFRQARTILEENGFSFNDVVRTWIYLRDILSWYGPFNRARTAAFQEAGLLKHCDRLPASTGIGITPWAGQWCSMDLIAVKGKVDLQTAHNPTQNEPWEYGSMFSRGTVWTNGGVRTIHVSGTAAIDTHGESISADDPEKQISITMDNVRSLLESQGARLQDIALCTVFLKTPDLFETYSKIRQEYCMENVPTVTVRADVCRPELAVELEAIALVNG